MQIKQTIFMLFLILITACLPQVVANSQREVTLSTTPKAPIAEYFTFLPLLLDFRESEVTPSPDITLTPITPEPTISTTPSTPEPTSSTTPPTPDPTAEPTAEPTIDPSPEPTPISNAIVADHYAINEFEDIPDNAISSAVALEAIFKHQSVGQYIYYMGLACLAGTRTDPSDPAECLLYAQNPYDPYDNRNWDWSVWDQPTTNAEIKTDQWVSLVNDQQGNYQVLGMKYCFADAWNLDFDYYRVAMEQLEQTYPQKTFIWSTTALIRESVIGDYLEQAEILQTFNQQLRDYAHANNKVLYDIADIESHDVEGNSCISYGYEALCEEYAITGSHPNVIASIRLAKGYWWLMARIGGWDGN